MVRHCIPKAKVNTLRRMFIAGKFSRVKAAKDLCIARTTVNLYIREFKLVQLHHPDKLADMNFYFPIDRRKEREKELQAYLSKVLPGLIAEVRGPRLRSDDVFAKYKLLMPGGYSITPFKKYFFKWCLANDISLHCTKMIESFTPEQQATITHWRLSNDHQKWKIATVLEAAHNRKSLLKTMVKVECCFKTVLLWIDIFKEKGLDGYGRTYTVNSAILAGAKQKKDNLIHLMQQSPKLYGFQKTSWTTIDLAKAFTETYGIALSRAAVSGYLRKSGIRIRKAKEVLTSPDPLYREKFNAIQDILSNLGEKEKFFSIDEYGPFAVKPKGGRALSIPGSRPVFKQTKHGKGWFVMTAALELSTNQMTHFYSMIKDTGEMIKLIDLLIERYPDEEKLYLSWDAASWHASKLLYKHIEEVNSDDYRKDRHSPLIALAPLPASAQFLNVIESVFSGMAKSVIHNTDYESVEDCKQALDNYFDVRNKHFLENPTRAGKKIWGKERVIPVFDKANICKSPYHR